MTRVRVRPEAMERLPNAYDLILVGGGLASSLIAWRLSIDRPEDIVDAIFKHYEGRAFAPLPIEHEMLLNL